MFLRISWQSDAAATLETVFSVCFTEPLELTQPLGWSLVWMAETGDEITLCVLLKLKAVALIVNGHQET